MNKTLVIYHGGCRDGFCAAWVFNKFKQSYTEDNPNEIEYHPGFYGQEPPDFKDRDVVILDFCYPIEIMKQIVKDCESLIWLDHHKTALPFYEYLNLPETQNDSIKWEFDNERSGAGITWDFFFEGEDRPWLVNYVEDRDLWLKNLENSDIINAYIACLEFDFRIWEAVSDIDLDIITERGLVALLKTEQYVREVCKNVYFKNIYQPEKDLQKILDDKVPTWDNIPIVNICQIDCSEVLHELCKRYPDSPFSLYWFKRADGLYQYGLRSIGDFDVSTVAKLFGGGGHKNAAGFQSTYLLQELQ